MMMVARRSGDDGRVTVANSYKQLHQPGALGNECTTVISKPPHTPFVIVSCFIKVSRAGEWTKLTPSYRGQ